MTNYESIAFYKFHLNKNQNNYVHKIAAALKNSLVQIERTIAHNNNRLKSLNHRQRLIIAFITKLHITADCCLFTNTGEQCSGPGKRIGFDSSTFH